MPEFGPNREYCQRGLRPGRLAYRHGNPRAAAEIADHPQASAQFGVVFSG